MEFCSLQKPVWPFVEPDLVPVFALKVWPNPQLDGNNESRKHSHPRRRPLMHQADRFLFSLVVHAGRRGRQFVLKKEYATELTDKWLYLMADVDPKKVRNGTRSEEERQRLVDAMLSLNKLPLYVEGADDDSTSSYLSDPDF